MKSCYGAASPSTRVFIAVAIVISGLAIAVIANSPEDLKAADLLDLSALQSPRAASSMLVGVTKAGKRLVTVGEHGYILLSDDDGGSWRQAKSVPVRVLLTQVRFANEQRGWAVGHSGVVLRTDDGGETWVKQLDGAQAARIALDSVQANPVTKAVSKSELALDPLASAERLVREGADKPFFDIFVESEDKLFVLGAYNLMFRTEDGGKTWQSWRSRVDNPREMHLYGMKRAGQDLFIVGEQGLVLRSSDNGLTFKKLSFPYVGSLFGLVTAKTGELVVFGMRGHAFWSGDQGQSWRKIETGSTQSFLSGTELQDGTLVIGTIAGELMTSMDQGRTFQRISTPVRTAIADVTQAPGGALIVAGMRGAMRIADTKNLAQETRAKQ